MQVTTTTLIRYAARWLGAAVLLGACALALALPTPKDIEAAVNAGHLSQAETLLREVLQDKPNSARAHYELGEVLGRQAKYDDALAELQRAKSIDSSLKFASTPEKFQQTLDKVNAAASAAKLPAATAPAHPAVAVAPAPAPAASGLNLNYVFLGIGVLVLVAFLIRRNAQANQNAMVYSTPAPAGFGAQYTPNAPGYGPGYAPGYGAPMQGGVGSGVGGAVLGGVAGLAAGYAISKALEGEHHNGVNHDGSTATGNSGGYVPFDAPAAPDLGNFDAGAGNGWDAPDAGGDGGDDNW